ncbi:peptidase S8/S53 subtilisin kexin sedolisin [Actinomadura logoneensis]|uniref:Peptidase S8/S53 subtilisin kexin sedolisin n=1 Tax=Actinomadura logoneensis TaxID=2293572 RepID=A0A372JC71_9ACTN|nr:sialidase family protein [Actinomadura logoneensis]RFU37615.1 peptidase S8/S53 subtilisin kexin sedolisin [Actinomadura logoneensis]
MRRNVIATTRRRGARPGLRAAALVTGAALALSGTGVAWADQSVSSKPPTGWETVGPDSVGGSVGLSPGRPDELAVMTASPQLLWLSEDRGAHWRLRDTVPKTYGATRSFVVDPSDPRRMYLLVAKAVGFGTYEGWLMRSTDRGETWSTLRHDTQDGPLQLAVSGRTVVAEGLDTIGVSTDGGDSWRDIPRPWEREGMAAPLPKRMLSLVGDDLYAATTAPGQDLWVVRGIGGAHPVPERLGQPGRQTITEVAASRWGLVVTAGHALYGTTDRGRSWRLLVADKAANLYGPQIFGDDVFVTTSDAVYASRDRGRTFARWNVPIPGQGVGEVAPVGGARGTTLVSDPYVGLYSTTNGRDYRPVGVPSETATNLLTARDRRGREVLVSAGVQDLFHTPVPTGEVTAATRRWTRVTSDALHSSPKIGVSSRDPRRVWRAEENGQATGVYRSDDGGATWTRNSVVADGGNPAALLVHPADPRRLFVVYASVDGWRIRGSDDEGATWWTAGLPDAAYSSLAGDPRDPRRVWAGTSSGLLRSDDGGRTFTTVAEDRTSHVLVDPRDPRRVLAGGSDLRLSTDGGATFRTVQPAADGNLERVIADPRRPGTLYAAWSGEGRAGVWRSDDAGRTWRDIGAGLPSAPTSSLATSGDGRWLFAGTNYAGVQRLPLG